jgi:hypothetical protein
LRVLECKKNNYGPDNTASVPIRWQDGVYVVERKDAFDQTMAEVHAEEVFLNLLRGFTAQGRNVTDKKGTSYAPARFADQAEARAGGLDNKALAAAMDRLFTAGRLKVVTEGPPSHPRTRLVEVASTDVPSTLTGASTTASINLPSASTNPEKASTKGVCTSLLIPPSPVEAGKGVVEATRPAPPGTQGRNRAKGDSSPARIIADCPPETHCLHCQQAGDVKRIVDARFPGTKSETLHERCAAAWFEAHQWLNGGTTMISFGVSNETMKEDKR